jgi:hypothetical protein
MCNNYRVQDGCWNCKYRKTIYGLEEWMDWDICIHPRPSTEIAPRIVLQGICDNHEKGEYREQQHQTRDIGPR